MYATANGYTYLTKQEVMVGDLVVLPPAPWSDIPSVACVTSVDTNKPTNYDGPFKSVIQVIKVKNLFASLNNEQKLTMLRDIADSLGFNITKKPVNRG